MLEDAVFGVPDEVWGESVRAAARYKCPGVIDRVDGMPRTGSGKIDKKALREPFWRGRARRIN